MMNTYQDLLALAEREARNTGIDINTSLKEILHYDILYALSQSPLGKQLVFQGGTALRLCYRGNRYSEDLDFVCGTPETLEHMTVFKEILVQVMAERYGLEVIVKDPASVCFDPGQLGVGRWTASVNIPRPNKSNKQVQKIKIEVVNIPSHDPEAMVLTRNYPGMAPAYDSIILRVSSLKEILADKVVAVAGRKYIKARDLWDLNWLMNKHVEIDYSLITQKLVDYNETDIFVPNMEQRMATLRETDAVKAFEDEMSRFLPAPLQQQMAQMENFSGSLMSSVAGYLEAVLKVYQG
ncbi:MAG: nucleotidyl transferase AbiEii/AbiGii toxin family protein [Gammaproteobacteria bacterium]|nr:MAG: nucleotidyl transferase AbiEii/AbiGii toxin family protein [Gammaproteobacteria bacterium]